MTKAVRFHLHEVPGVVSQTQDEDGFQGLGGGPNGELVFTGDSVWVWEDEEVSGEDGGDSCTTV